MIELDGRVALVTGASRGIGAAVARRLAQAGADVAVACHTRRTEAESVAAEVRAHGRRALVASADLAEPGAAERLVEQVHRELGALHILVANAGTWPAEPVPLARMDDTRWRETLRVNLDAVYATVRAALRRMTGGSVVIVSSTAGQRGEADHADYAAAKGALISLTKSLAIECAPEVTVNCVAPGWVDTDMAAPAFTGRGRERIAGTIPLGRIATADDIAGPIAFLVSPLARHITGEILNVNGGSVLCG